MHTFNPDSLYALCTVHWVMGSLPQDVMEWLNWTCRTFFCDYLFRFLMGCCGWEVKVWSVSSGLCVHRLKGHKAKINCITLNPANPYQVIHWEKHTSILPSINMDQLWSILMHLVLPSSFLHQKMGWSSNGTTQMGFSCLLIPPSTVWFLFAWIHQLISSSAYQVSFLIWLPCSGPWSLTFVPHSATLNCFPRKNSADGDKGSSLVSFSMSSSSGKEKIKTTTLTQKMLAQDNALSMGCDVRIILWIVLAFTW